MNERNSEAGAVNLLIIPLITAVIMLFASLGFGVWAYAERTDYKNNSDRKSAAAVKVAVDKAKSDKDNEFLKREQDPLRDFSGPTNFGTIKFKYPKTYAAYVSEQPTSFLVLMQPTIVSARAGAAYSLRIDVAATPYDQALTEVEGLVRSGKVTATAYILPKMPEVLGLRVDGEIADGKNGSVIYLPVRDKTLKITNEAKDNAADFNDIILPSFTFEQ